MKIKRLFMTGFLIGMIALVSFGQTGRSAEASISDEPKLEKSVIDIAAASDTVPVVSFEELVNQVIQAVTDSQAEITLPGKFDPKNSQNIFDWWIFIYGLVAPIGMFVILKFWPSASKPELILKSTSIGIVVLLIIVFLKGGSIVVIGQAVLAFVFQAFSYDKLYNPLGLKSARTNAYEA